MEMIHACTPPVRDWTTLIERSVRANRQGIYEIPALPVGGPDAMQAIARGTGSLQ